MLAGSAVVAGSGLVTATRIGADRWVEELVAEARQFVLTNSELRVGVDQILRIISWIIVPLGALSVWSQLRTEEQSFDEALVSAVAGIVGLVPQGLVLLVSLAMAVATVRLGCEGVLVQELHAVEGLAHRRAVRRQDRHAHDGRVRAGRRGGARHRRRRAARGLGALVGSEKSPTAPSKVIADQVKPPEGWQPTKSPSPRPAWSGTTFESHGTWVLGVWKCCSKQRGKVTSRPTAPRCQSSPPRPAVCCSSPVQIRRVGRRRCPGRTARRRHGRVGGAAAARRRRHHAVLRRRARAGQDHLG